MCSCPFPQESYMVFSTEFLSKCLIMGMVVRFQKLSLGGGGDCLIPTGDGSLHFSLSPGSFTYFLMFIFERDRDRAPVGRGREKGRHRIRGRSRLGAISTESDAGLKPTNREIVTRAKLRCSTNCAPQVSLSWFL